MIGAVTMIIGAGIFFIGFIIGTFYAPIKPIREKKRAHKTGSVILNEEYHNLLTYDGNPKL